MSILNFKPQRYFDEARVMEQVADVLDCPVPYQRFEGWSNCPYVSYVYLPRVELTDDKVHKLADLLQQLPRLSVVDAHYVYENQSERVQQLKAELPERIFVGGRISSSASQESQRRAYVAGIASE